MAFKDAISKLGDSVKKTADNIAEKSSDIALISKLNKSIKEEEDKISKGLLEIGKNVYQNYVSGKEAVDLKSTCDSITQMHKKINNFKEQIEKIKAESKNKNSKVSN
ncbi:MAG: hypothetical protein FWC47_14010 [Oscillospiraceae bacterium]|nr:hypothetical protein [Oscillospiraceae bacterium]